MLSFFSQQSKTVFEQLSIVYYCIYYLLKLKSKIQFFIAFLLQITLGSGKI